MDTSPTSTSTSKKDNNKIYFLLFVVLALFSTNAILFFKNKKSNEQVVQLGDDKTRMQTEIDKIEAELDKASADYALLNEQMEQEQANARDKIAQLRKALKAGELTQQELNSAQNEVKQLRLFVSQYIADIEQLKNQNTSLTSERDSLKTTVTEVTDRANNLEKENRILDRKVKAAAALKAVSLVITSVRVKSSGKITKVNKSTAAQKLNINFRLLNNELSEQGLHNVYLRIIDPKGNLIVGEAGRLYLDNGDDLQITYKTAIDYVNDNRLYTISWTNPEAFIKGTYTVTLYADGFTVGTTKLTLK